MIYRAILLMLIPLITSAQPGNWQIDINTGFNLSFNQMKCLQGNKENMSNTIRPGGWWSLLFKYPIHENTMIHTGIGSSAYKYQYRYRIDQGNGEGSKGQAYIWEIPLGIENIWKRAFIEFSSVYGIKYSLNRLGAPFNLESTSQVFNPNGELVYEQHLREFSNPQNNHMASLYVTSKLTFKLRSRFTLAISLGYNQGLNQHESFLFEAINIKPLENNRKIDRYAYSTKRSYLHAGLVFNCLFKTKQEHIPQHTQKPAVISD
ncbi:MAG: hypothetical protein ISR01_06255 [Chitinophagales bacterium]|nr:hypothetical protein [Chitinophagales bacterium]